MTSAAAVPLTLYTRDGCHLCEDAGTLLARLAGEMGVLVDLTVVNLNAEPDLEPVYGQRIPVFAAAGRPELAAPIREPDLRALLAALAGR